MSVQNNIVKICTSTQILDQHVDHYNEISSHPDHETRNSLQAAFWSSKLWPPESEIKIGFLDDISCNSTFTCYNAYELTAPKNQKPECETLHAKFPNINKTIDKSVFKGVVDPLQTQFDNESKKDVKEMIKTIFNERWLPLINLDVTFVDNIDEANVRISFKNIGSWSLVGTDCLHAAKGSATINFQWFDVGTILHEFGHMLGMIHEHQNPRGKQIDWNVPVVESWAQDTQGWDAATTKKNIIDPYKINQINGSSFDENSIMLYFFPTCLVNKGTGTHQNFNLSKTDIEWMQKMYPNKNKNIDYFAKYYGGVNKNNIGLYIFIGLTIIGILIIVYIMYKQYKKKKDNYSYTRSKRGYNRRNYK
jgi:hypothetical protein